jgi:hypothetical protein
MRHWKHAGQCRAPLTAMNKPLAGRTRQAYVQPVAKSDRFL